MNIDQYKNLLENKSIDFIRGRLKDVLEQIQFLESIYMTGGENNVFSKEFSNSAYKERQELCQLSSALYSIIRDKEKKG